MKKLPALLLALTLLFSFTACGRAAPVAKVNAEEFKTNYTYVFVHGLSGWGSYDFQNHFMPYWGMQNGDLMKYLNRQGFHCVAASVAPTGSAWDRACELYAQLTGSVTDYGAEHSVRCKHDRYGKDFSKKPLIEKWDKDNKINLLGHSFGGATVRTLCELMANGSEAEQKATTDGSLSPLFEGGKADWVYSVTALAAPMNGTTAYDVDDTESIGTDRKARLYETLTKLMSAGTKEKDDGRAAFDNANFDMLIDNAKKMNDGMETLKSVYWFSFPCNSTVQQADGTYLPDETKTEALFMKPATLMGRYTGTTPAGVTIDESWQMNDGLVNTISATAPFGAPQKAYEEGKVAPGEWNIMPVYDGDHMALQGGLTKKNDVRGFYTEHLTRINKL